MIEQYDLSERHACQLVGLSRDSYRHPPMMSEKNRILSAAIIDIAQVRRRFGYRRIHDLLRPTHPNMNHKRFYRLYSAAKLSVEKRKKAKRPSSERIPLQIAQAVNEVWSMDFVSDSLASGRRIKCLTVADDFSHECVDIGTDFGISGQYVTRLLGPGSHVSWLSQGRAHRQRPRVHQQSIHGMGTNAWHSSSAHPTRKTHAERLHREFQRQVQRRVPE